MARSSLGCWWIAGCTHFAKCVCVTCFMLMNSMSIYALFSSVVDSPREWWSRQIFSVNFRCCGLIWYPITNKLRSVFHVFFCMICMCLFVFFFVLGHEFDCFSSSIFRCFSPKWDGSYTSEKMILSILSFVHWYHMFGRHFCRFCRHQACQERPIWTQNWKICHRSSLLRPLQRFLCRGGEMGPSLSVWGAVGVGP